MPEMRATFVNSVTSDHDPSQTGLRVFISAAEPSADLHGASLIRAVHELDPEVRFAGIAGPHMQRAGCHTLFDMTAHAAMAAGALRRIPEALTMLRRGRRYLATAGAELAVVIDSPTLHTPMAKFARRAGVPVLYFIAPQVWAWCEQRIGRLRTRVDKMAVILPFEEEYFRQHGIDAEYVGHPLFDTLARRTIDPQRVQELHALGRPLIAVLPGSRTHVVSEVLPGQLAVAAGIAARFPNAHFCVSVASEQVAPLIHDRLRDIRLPHSLHSNENGAILSACDLALVASGTATLETAYYHVPMIVMYNASRLGYYLFGRWAMNRTRLRQFSLVNILAGRELVPEFMPFFTSPEPILAKALALLESPADLQALRAEIAAAIDPLVKTGAAHNTAAIVLDMLTRVHAGRPPA